MGVPTINPWYEPRTKVAVLWNGVFVNAEVISNKAHLWNALGIPYMIKIEGVEAYKYASHDQLRFIAPPPPVLKQKRKKTKQKGLQYRE